MRFLRKSLGRESSRAPGAPIIRQGELLYKRLLRTRPHNQPVMSRSDPVLFLERHPEVTRLVGELPKEKIIAVLLFGSSAEGNFRPFSDIDICIITNHNLPSEEKEFLHSFSSRRIHMSLFSDLPPAVQFRVLRDGYVLHCTNELAFHRARVRAVRAYLSVKPLIDRNIEHVLG